MLRGHSSRGQVSYRRRELSSVHLHGPELCRFTQCLEIDLAVQERAGEIAVPEHVGDVLERDLARQTGRECVAK